MKSFIFTLAFLLTVAASAGPTAGSSTKAIGSPTAPITIELYSDFQCPHCKEFHDETLPSLINEWVNTGKVYLVRHYFVLKFPYSKLAAQYACAAERIGRYNQACDALFQKQQIWGQNGNVDQAVCSALTPAEAQKVRALVKDPSVTLEIEKDTATGMAQNVKSTPTLIVEHNGKRQPIEMAVSYPMLKVYLNSVLSQ
ncbi:MAG TPA: thioredoxin domain-containing protein [Bryobacteraceae bacterium]|jgi:protein-disulfide isomerase